MKAAESAAKYVPWMLTPVSIPIPRNVFAAESALLPVTSRLSMSGSLLQLLITRRQHKAGGESHAPDPKQYNRYTDPCCNHIPGCPIDLEKSQKGRLWIRMCRLYGQLYQLSGRNRKSKERWGMKEWRLKGLKETGLDLNWGLVRQRNDLVTELSSGTVQRLQVSKTGKCSIAKCFFVRAAIAKLTKDSVSGKGQSLLFRQAAARSKAFRYWHLQQFFQTVILWTMPAESSCLF